MGLDKLLDEIGGAGNLKPIIKDVDKVGDEAVETEKQVKSLKQKLGGAWRTGAAAVGKQFNKMEKDAKAAERHVGRLKNMLGGVWRITGGIILFNIIRHITHSIRDLIGTVIDFEKEMRNVNSVAQLSEQQFAELNEEVINLALDPRIKDGPANLAAGLYEVVSAGYSTADGLIIMEKAAIAASAGMTTTATAADVIISTLGAYNLTAAEAGMVSDKLFQIVNISKYTFEDLASAMDSVTPSASALGVSIDDIGAGLATMAARGVDADTATVQMNAILSGLLKPSEKMIEVINGLGYASGSNMLDVLGFVGTMETLNKVINGDEELAAEMFGDVRALRGLFNLVNGGTEKLVENQEKMKQSSEGVGATQKALNEQMKSNAFQMDVLRKNIQILAIMGFGILAPYLNRALTGINTFITKFIGYFRDMRKLGYGIWQAMKIGLYNTLSDMFGPKTAKMIMEWVAKIEKYFYIIKGAIQDVWKVVKPILDFLLDHLNIVIPAILGLVVAMKLWAVGAAIVALAMAPISIPMLAFIALVMLLSVAWYNNWGDIQGKTKVAVDFIMKWLGKLWDYIGPLVQYIIDIFQHDIEPNMFEDIPDSLKPLAIVLGRVAKTIRVFIKAWQEAGAVAAFKTLPVQFRALTRAIRKFLESIGLGSFGRGLEKVLRNVMNIVSETVSFVDNLVHGRWKKAWDDLVSIGKNYVMLLINGISLLPRLLWDLFKMIPWGTIAQSFVDGVVIIATFLVTTGIPYMLQAGFDLIANLYNGLSSYWTDTVVPWLSGLVSEMLGYFNTDDIFNLFYATGNFLISAISEGISFAWNWMMGWFKDLPGQMAGVFAGIYNTFYNIGWSLMNGLIGGLSSLWESLKGWVSSIVSKINEVPWDLVRKIWGWNPLGGGSGDESASQSMGARKTINMGSTSTSNIGARATGLVPAMAGGIIASSAAGSSQPVTINNYISGNGDPDAIAEIVVRKTLRALRRRSSGLA